MSEISISESSNPIDAVITWVNGNDTSFHSKMQTYLGGQCASKIPGAHHTRFASVNEIKYCLLSILTFAPFVRNIFIVTDNQDPNLNGDISSLFPNRLSSIKIVDHKEIFREFEQYLPTFNSRSIETMLWRIRGLSDNFIYFNDDVFLVRETKPEDWFINNQPILRGTWLLKPRFRFLWYSLIKVINKYLLGNSDFQPRPSYHIGQWLAAKVLGFRWRYFFFSHTPFAINRKRVEDFFTDNKELLEKNISYKFKNQEQFNFVSLCNHLEILKGNKFFTKPHLAYLQPYNRSKYYIDRKIRMCERNSRIKFLCVQSLEMCPEHDHQKLFGWMDKILGISKT